MKENRKKRFLITGAAGFIGFFLSKALLEEGASVIGIDNLNDYYDVKLKKDRLDLLIPYDHFTFHRMDIADREAMRELFSNHRFDVVVNLAAQAGVRYSLENPDAYIDANVVGFANILEGCRATRPDHLIYASSSSVYGMNEKIPFSTEDRVDHPVSLYAATKKSNELLAHAYSHLFHLPVTGLRFFTVYGPWGRPDMAYFKFAKAIVEGTPIDVYNHGQMKRDFTYIDDIVQGIIKLIDHPPEKSTPSGNTDFDIDKTINTSDEEKSPSKTDPAKAPYALYNIGNNTSVSLMEFIETLESLLGRKAQKNMLPMQPGDVPMTYANIDPLKKVTGFQPNTELKEGLSHFVKWYEKYVQ